MPAAGETSALDAAQLASLADWLRHEGVRVATQQCTQAQQLLVRLAGIGGLPENPVRLAALLGPIFCASPDEQRRFPAIFREWWKYETGETIGVENVREEKSGSAVRRTRGFGRWWWVYLAALMLAGGGFAWEKLRYREIAGVIVRSDGAPVPGAIISFRSVQFSADAEGQFRIRVRAIDPVAPLSVSQTGFRAFEQPVSSATPTPLRIVLADAPAPVPNPVRKDSTSRVERSPGREITGGRLALSIQHPRRFRLSALAALAAAVPLVLYFTGWLLVRWLRRGRKHSLERLQSETPRSLREVRLAGGAHHLLPGLGVRELARELRRRRIVQSRQIDAEATIAAALRSGGFVTPVFGSRSEPDYLLLIDRSSLQDHQAALADLVAETLLVGNVSIERWYFERDPARCSRTASTTAGTAQEVLDLEELSGRHPEHRVLVFSDGVGFFDGYTGHPRASLEVLQRWRETAVLTPESLERWGAREWAIERLGLTLLPLSRAGLSILAGAFAGHKVDLPGAASAEPVATPLHARATHRWLDREPPAPATVVQLCDDLALDLGPAGFQWLAACAIYPEVHWGITLRLGAALVPRARDLEALLPRLSRLPWLRAGFLPDWLRAALLSRLAPEVALRVRATLHEMLAAASLSPTGAAPLRIAMGEPETKSWWRRSGEWLQGVGRKALLRRSVANAAMQSPLRDYVFLRFMAGERPDALCVAAPSALARLLFRDGLRVMGIRPAVPLVACVLASSAAALLIGLRKPSVTVAEFSPDGSQVLTASIDDATARIWDAATGKPVGVPMTHQYGVTIAHFSPDGRTVITGSTDGVAQVWDAATGKTRGAPMKHPRVLESAEFSPDGQKILTVSVSTGWPAQLWDATSGKLLGDQDQYTEMVQSAEFSPDGLRVVTVSQSGTVWMWDAESGQAIGQPITGSAPFVAARFSTSGRTLLTRSFDTLQLWNVASGTALGEPMKHAGKVDSMAFSPDGERVVTASADGTARLWDAASGKPLGEPMVHGDRVNYARFNPDGQRVVTSSSDKTAGLWDGVSGQALSGGLPHEDVVWVASFAPDGRRLLTTSRDGIARVWTISQSTGPAALLIGCNYPGQTSPLATPVNDVRALAQVLNEQYGVTTTTLINPSHQVFRETLARFREILTSDDSAIIVVSGHGYEDGAPGSKIDFAFPLNVDDPAFKTDRWTAVEIADYFRSLPCRQAILIADADGAATLISGKPPSASISDSAKTRTLVSSASRGQHAMDGKVHSPFGRALLEFFWTSDGGFSGNELTTNAARLMVAAGLSKTEQTPAYGSFVAAGHEGGDFFFPKRIVPKRTLPDFDRVSEEDPALRRRDRMAEIQVLKNSRLVGENHLGLLVLRDQPPGDYGDYVKASVYDENADRSLVFQRLADEKKITFEEVQRQEAERIRSQAFPGEWIEEPDGKGGYSWVQKKAPTKNDYPAADRPPAAAK